MKNIKKEYIALGLIIVVLSAYLIFHKDGSEKVILPNLPDISKMDITRLEIAKAGTTLVIKKMDAAWVIGEDNFPADEAQVKAMVANIKGLKLTALVSEAEDYSRYDLDDEHKIKVTAFSNDKVARTFDLGKTASSFRHTFVKLDNDSRVFHAEQNFREAFEKKEDDLTNKKVLACEPESITRVNGNVEKTTFGYEKKKEAIKESTDVNTEETVKQPGNLSGNPPVNTDKTPQSPKVKELWADASGTEKDKTKVSEFLNIFFDLTCTNFIKGSKKEDFTDPLIKITLTGSKPFTLSIFNKKDEQGGYPAVSSETPFPFMLPAEKVDEIKTKLSGI